MPYVQVELQTQKENVMDLYLLDSVKTVSCIICPYLLYILLTTSFIVIIIFWWDEFNLTMKWRWQFDKDDNDDSTTNQPVQ